MTTKQNKTNIVPLIGLTVFSSSAIGLSLIAIPFIIPGFRRIILPYIPATDQQVLNVLKAVESRTHVHSTLIDLGCGDGRIVIESAKIGIKSFGVDLNPWLVLYAKIRSRLIGLHRNASFQCKDLWKVNTSSYNNIVIFGVEEMMPLLEKKIGNDCSESGNYVNVIACRFPFPNWKPIDTIGSGIDAVWKYRYPPFQLK